MKIVMMGSYPVYKFAEELRISPTAFKRVTSWNETLAEALAKVNGLEVHFITGTKMVKHTKTVQKERLKVTFLATPPKANMITFFQYSRWQVNKIMNEIKPDIVHGIGTEHIWPYIALKSRYPSIITVHGIMSEIIKKVKVPFIAKKRFFAFLEKYVLRKTKNLISINPYVEKALEKHTQAKIFQIENPINKLFFNNSIKKKTKKNIIFVGDIIPRKDILTLIEAFSQVLEKFQYQKDIVLNLVGPSPHKIYERQIRDLISQNKISNFVNFLGFKLPAEISKLYRESSLLVLSSIEETAPMCIAEAMCSGLPVVATNVGGVEFMVKDNITGFIVEKQNPHKFATGMLKILENKDLQKKMSNNAKKIALKRFFPDIIAGKTFRVYKKVLDQL